MRGFWTDSVLLFNHRPAGAPAEEHRDGPSGKAAEEFDKAEAELLNGKPDKAIDHYKHAWEKACKAAEKLPEP